MKNKVNKFFEKNFYWFIPTAFLFIGVSFAISIWRMPSEFRSGVYSKFTQYVVTNQILSNKVTQYEGQLKEFKKENEVLRAMLNAVEDLSFKKGVLCQEKNLAN